jgi:hypothetical protein
MACQVSLFLTFYILEYVECHALHLANFLFCICFAYIFFYLDFFLSLCI